MLPDRLRYFFPNGHQLQPFFLGLSLVISCLDVGAGWVGLDTRLLLGARPLPAVTFFFASPRAPVDALERLSRAPSLSRDDSADLRSRGALDSADRDVPCCEA